MFSYQITVKVHRVFPSICFKIASARLFQFHLVDYGDSGEIVTSFMRVGNYPTRNFATFGPLWLQPPFVRFSVRFFQFLLYTSNTGQMSDSIHLNFSNLQSLVFLVNSHSPLLCFGFKPLFIPKLQSHFA
jgi:hypothetical protein